MSTIMKYSLRFAVGLLFAVVAVNAFAVDVTHNVICHWRDDNGTPIGRIQQNCAGSTAVTLYSGKSWSEATVVSCGVAPCQLGSICESGLEWYLVDGACSCISDTFALALTSVEDGGECPSSPAGCPTVELSPSCAP